MRVTFYLIALLAVSGCSTTTKEKSEPEGIQVRDSYLLGEDAELRTNDAPEQTVEKGARERFVKLSSLGQSDTSLSEAKVEHAFKDSTTKVTVAANSLPIAQFLHYVFGEVLGANYIVNSDLKATPVPVTLNIQNPISKSEVFKVVADLLTRNQVSIDYENNTFFFQKNELSKAKAIIGIGKDFSDVPNTANQILQVIPLKFGIKISLESTLRKMIDGDISFDYEQGAFFIRSNRPNIIRAIELINLLDIPSNRGKHIGLMSLTYITVPDFLEEARQLLLSEGIQVGVGFDKTKNVILIPLNHIGAIAMFAPDEEIIERVRYWGDILDKPTQGENRQYFIFNPRFARASDVGDSIGGLLSLGGRSVQKANRRSTGASAQRLADEQPDAAGSNQTFSNSDVAFVVDELSNSLIFNTTGNNYQKLLPLLNQLDVLPKQIMMEVMIAEVTLTDDFKFGVEFALKNSSKFSLGTLGAFGAGDTGGIVLSGLDSNFSGNTSAEALASFFRENRLVNVVSNPTLLVRDGTNASIKVGDSIPVQGGTVVDQGVQTTNISYRDTGVEVSVSPTVNAQGVIIMQISLDISNTVSTAADSTTPTIFQRNLNTEAVVESGQTVILGGLISENRSNGETKVPVLGDIPVVGNLFKGRNDSATKTELVMLVTPKVLGDQVEWEKLISDFQTTLDAIRLVE